jgi:hypothetical protein
VTPNKPKRKTFQPRLGVVPMLPRAKPEEDIVNENEMNPVPDSRENSRSGI